MGVEVKPCKLTPKQEKFCQVYIQTSNASEAYRQSYNAKKTKEDVIHVKASQLLANGKVAVRVMQLQDALSKKHAVTVESIAAELEEARLMAMKDDVQQSSAAVSASMSKAKLYGLVVDKSRAVDEDDKTVIPVINVNLSS